MAKLFRASEVPDPRAPRFQNDQKEYLIELRNFLAGLTRDLERISEANDIPTATRYGTGTGYAFAGTATTTDAVVVRLVADLKAKGILG